VTSIRSAVCVRCPPRWLLFRVETDSGEVGWGEAIGDIHEEVEAALNSLGERVCGADIHEISRLLEVQRKGRFWRDGVVLDAALSALEMALWDLKGKQLGAPVHELLGGRVRDQVRVYRNAWGRTAEEFASSAAEAVSQSMTAVKVSPAGPTANVASEADLASMLEVVTAVRESVGDEVHVAVDLHGRLSPATARRAIELLAPLDPFFVEEPCLPEGSASHLADLRTLRLSQKVPLATGERLRSLHTFSEHLLPTPVVDVIQPDLAQVGGILPALEIGAMAAAAQASLAPHCPYGPVHFAATMQVAAASPALLIQEFQSLGGAGSGGGIPGGGQNWQFDLLETPFEIVDGHVATTTAPGIGITVIEERIDEYMDSWNPHPPTLWTLPDGSHAEW